MEEFVSILFAITLLLILLYAPWVFISNTIKLYRVKVQVKQGFYGWRGRISFILLLCIFTFFVGCAIGIEEGRYSGMFSRSLMWSAIFMTPINIILVHMMSKGLEEVGMNEAAPVKRKSMPN